MTLSALLDHLWQSTLLALVAGLTVLALRKAPASARYGLWFAASAKFLVPFAALAALGRLAAPRLTALLPQARAHATPPFPEAALIERAAQPLSKFPLEPSSPVLQAPLLPAGPGPAAAQLAHQTPLHLDLLPILMAVWCLGFAAVLMRWLVRWGRVRRSLRSATPLDWRAPMPVLASPSLLEPGLIGILRPALVVPESLPEHLTRAQIDAILAHEVCHLRRRDNLTAAIHTLVEAVFWFHPLVWWIGVRLITEREKACDEAVVREGHDRATYARSLVESARLYVQSPLSCVAGASGSDLKTRVEAIMTAPPVLPLSLTKKALLAAAGACVVATPVAAALVTTPESAKTTGVPAALAAVLAPARSQTILSASTPPSPAMAPDQAVAAPITVAAQEAALPPAPTIAAAAPASLKQDIVTPDAMASLSATPQPVQLTAAAPPAPLAPTSAVEVPQPADATQQALRFVQAYAAFSTTAVTARWYDPICVGVGGLAPSQASAVWTRIAEVARTVGVGMRGGNCRTNVEIEFALDPQKTLDQAVKSHPRILGDASDTGAVTTVTRPIQAWYLTNGGQYASVDTDGLKVLADWQTIEAPWANTSQWQTTTVSPYAGGGGPFDFSGPSGATSPDFGPNATRRLLHVLVIIDARRTGGVKLGALADNAAMLVLSQSRSLDHCQALPSVTDLFAGACTGRVASGGLTQADYAYLAALYSVRPSFSKIADQMAEILANPTAGAPDQIAKKRGGTGSRVPGPRAAGFSVPGPVSFEP